MLRKLGKRVKRGVTVLPAAHVLQLGLRDLGLRLREHLCDIVHVIGVLGLAEQERYRIDVDLGQRARHVVAALDLALVNSVHVRGLTISSTVQSGGHHGSAHSWVHTGVQSGGHCCPQLSSHGLPQSELHESRRSMSVQASVQGGTLSRAADSESGVGRRPMQKSSKDSCWDEDEPWSRSQQYSEWAWCILKEWRG